MRNCKTYFFVCMSLVFILLGCRRSEETFVFPDTLTLNSQAEIDAICSELLSVDTIPSNLIISDFNQDSQFLITDLSCFENIKVVSGHLGITIQNLNSLGFLENIFQVNELSISGCENLEIVAFPVLSECERITIVNNPKLKTISIPNADPSDWLEVVNNQNLENFDGLDGADTINSVFFQRNPRLNNISGFSNLSNASFLNFEFQGTTLSESFMQSLREVTFEFKIDFRDTSSNDYNWLFNLKDAVIGDGLWVYQYKDPIENICPALAYCQNPESYFFLNSSSTGFTYFKEDIIGICE